MVSKQACIAARDPVCFEDSQVIGSSHWAKVSKQARNAPREPVYEEDSRAIGPRHRATSSKQASIAARDLTYGENSPAIGSSHRAKVSKQASIEQGIRFAGRTYSLSDQAIGRRLASKQALRKGSGLRGELTSYRIKPSGEG